MVDSIDDLEEGFYLRQDSNNMFYVYPEKEKWKAESRTGNIFDITKGIMENWKMIRVDPTSYMQMAKLNTQFIKSKLEQLAQPEKPEIPNPVKGLKLSLFPMGKQY